MKNTKLDYQTVLTEKGLRNEKIRIRKKMHKELNKLKENQTLKWIKTFNYYKGQLDYIQELITYLK